MNSSYCEMFKDPLMSQPPIWFKSLIGCEYFLQLPFFCAALYAMHTGQSPLGRQVHFCAAHLQVYYELNSSRLHCFYPAPPASLFRGLVDPAARHCLQRPRLHNTRSCLGTHSF